MSSVIKLASAVWLFLAATAAVWSGLSLEIPFLIDAVLFLTFAFGGGLFLANLLIIWFLREHRRAHAAFCVLFVLSGALMAWMADLHIQKRHRWFLREGIVYYQTLADTVARNRQTLTGDLQTVRIQSSPGFIRAQTNDNGSLTIWFPGGDGGLRHGYIYHSGSPLTGKPGNNPGDYFVWLTNSWYEY